MRAHDAAYYEAVKTRFQDAGLEFRIHSSGFSVQAGNRNFGLVATTVGELNAWLAGYLANKGGES